MPRIQSRTQGLCRLLSAPAGNSTFPTLSPRIFPHVLGPLPRLLLWCYYAFLPTRHRPSRNLEPVGATAFATIAVIPYSNFSTAQFTRLQSFTNVQARGFARHPDCSYRSESVFRVLKMSCRVRWLFHRFRFGPQSDSLCLSRNPGNPLGSRDFYFRAYLGLCRVEMRRAQPQAKAWLCRRFRFTCPFSPCHSPRFLRPPSHPGRSDCPSPVGGQ